MLLFTEVFTLFPQPLLYMLVYYP